jgi:hypothetical protein
MSWSVHEAVDMRTRTSMRYSCRCGRPYLIQPKEIPLSADEDLFCVCGRRIKGERSTRYFDYEALPIKPSRGEDED